mgnify:CR=1 FL=1
MPTQERSPADRLPEWVGRVKAGDRLAVLLGDRDYIGAREDWEQAKNGGDREC